MWADGIQISDSAKRQCYSSFRGLTANTCTSRHQTSLLWRWQMPSASPRSSTTWESERASAWPTTSSCTATLTPTRSSLCRWAAAMNSPALDALTREPNNHCGSRGWWLKAIFRRRRGIDRNVIGWRRRRSASVIWWKEMPLWSCLRQEVSSGPHLVMDKQKNGV